MSTYIDWLIQGAEGKTETTLIFTSTFDRKFFQLFYFLYNFACYLFLIYIIT